MAATTNALMMKPLDEPATGAKKKCGRYRRVDGGHY
jgi:hypothetical protein